jgi:hypothetical protein
MTLELRCCASFPGRDSNPLVKLFWYKITYCKITYYKVTVVSLVGGFNPLTPSLAHQLRLSVVKAMLVARVGVFPYAVGSIGVVFVLSWVLWLLFFDASCLAKGMS